MRRLAQIALMGVLVLAAASLAGAQQMPQPMVRLGDFIEVGNDVFMHIMASADIRYKTIENDDFEQRVRDRTPLNRWCSSHAGPAPLCSLAGWYRFVPVGQFGRP